MSHNRILLTLRGDREVADKFDAIIVRAIEANRSINSQVLIELGIIDEEKVAKIPRAGRKPTTRRVPCADNSHIEPSNTNQV